jgi:phosphatidate cytidylyltransferase
MGGPLTLCTAPDILRPLPRNSIAGDLVLEGTMLRWRIAISIVLVSILAGLFWIDHYRGGKTAPVLMAFTLLIGARGCWELIDLLKTRNKRLSYPLAVIGCSVVIASGWAAVWIPQLPGETPISSTLTSLGIVILTFALVVLMLFIAGAIRYRQPGDNMETISAELMTVAYIGVLLAITAQLRWVGDDLGYYALASVLVAAKSGDIGAYAFGKSIGGPKMAPLLSPGKTWAGAVGSIVGSILGGMAWMQFALHPFEPSAKAGDWWWLAIYSGMIGLAGMVGDLCESLIKRDVGRKDSAPLMPGFGGLLDLLDSVIFAGPVAVVMWMTMPLVERP